MVSDHGGWVRRARLKRRLGGPPIVTVIIPTYNWAAVLAYSISSVLAQELGEWELLVIGDGCTDESERVVRSFTDPRISWFNLAKNGGTQVGPNNLGLRQARGEYVAYLGHDDLWLPNHLEQLCRAADDGARFVHAHQLRIVPGAPPHVHPGAGWTYSPGDWVPPTAMMHRRRDARAVGGWRFPEPGQFEDPEADLWKRLAARFGPPVCLDTVTSVKLPAALRKGVYSERPSDEQAFWWSRVNAAPDAATFVAEALADVDHRPPARYPDPASSPEAEAPVDALERHRRRRRYKGLDD